MALPLSYCVVTLTSFPIVTRPHHQKHPNGEKIELKRIISSREYEWMKNLYADPSRHVVVQRRYTFLWEQKAFAIHRYLQPKAKKELCILHCQASQSPTAGTSSTSTSDPTFPPFLKVGDPVGEEGRYSAYHISLRN